MSLWLTSVTWRVLTLTCLQMYLRELLRLMLPHFHQHLTRLGEDGLQLLFCHRWILLCFKREFPDTEALRMWEACWAHYQVRAKSARLLCIHQFVRKKHFAYTSGRLAAFGFTTGMWGFYQDTNKKRIVRSERANATLVSLQMILNPSLCLLLPLLIQQWYDL